MTTPDNVSSLHAGLFARDGHLTMLTLDRFEVGELSLSACEAIIDHVEACTVCGDRLAAMRSDAEVIAPPQAQPSAVSRHPWLGTAAIAGIVAAAAALFVVMLPQPQQAERSPSEEGVLTASPYTTTMELESSAVVAAALDFSVAYADEGRSGAVHMGDRVDWAVPLSLEVSPHEAGYVAVVAATESSEDDALEDTDGGGAGYDVQVLMPVTHLAARSGPHAFTVAHHSEHDLGKTAQEHLIAMFCEESFALSDHFDPFDPELPSLRDDCTTVEFSLTRYGEVADS